MVQSLKGKIAFNTGAGKGIGRATALALAEYIVAQLKLNPRIFIPQSRQWAMNPF